MNIDEIIDQISIAGYDNDFSKFYINIKKLRKAIETEKKQAVKDAVIEALGGVRSQLPTSTNNSSRYDFVKIDSCLDQKIKAMKVGIKRGNQ